MSRTRRMILSVLVAYLLVLSAIALPVLASPAARAISIDAYDHIPDQPLTGEEVEVTATVTGSPTTITAQVCVNGSCLPPVDMNHIGGDNYNLSIGPFDTDATVSVHLFASDGGSDSDEAEFEFVVHAVPTRLVMDARLVSTVIYPGGDLSIVGTVIYDNGLVATGASISLAVLPGALTSSATADAAGNFTMDLTGPASSGNYTLNLTALRDSLHGYRELALSVVDSPKADLTGELLTYSPAGPFVGDTVLIHILVSNSGNANASAFWVKLYQGLNALSGLRVPVLNSSEDRTLVFTWNTSGSTKGNVGLKILLDHNNTIEESNEDNNAIQFSIELDEWVEVQRPADLTHHVFVEVMSATYCGPCLKAEALLQDMWYTQESQDFFFMTEVIDQLDIADQRSQDLSVEAVPAAIFDAHGDLFKGAPRDSNDYLSRIYDSGKETVDDVSITVSMSNISSTSLIGNAAIKGLPGSSFTLKMFVVEPVSRYLGNDGSNIPFGLLGLAYSGEVQLGQGGSPYSYGSIQGQFNGTDIDKNNIGVIGVLYDDSGRAVDCFGDIEHPAYGGMTIPIGSIRELNASVAGDDVVVNVTMSGDGTPVLTYTLSGLSVVLNMTRVNATSYTARLGPFNSSGTMSIDVALRQGETELDTKATTVYVSAATTPGSDGGNGDGGDGGLSTPLVVAIAGIAFLLFAVILLVVIVLVVRSRKKKGDGGTASGDGALEGTGQTAPTTPAASAEGAMPVTPPPAAVGGAAAPAPTGQGPGKATPAAPAPATPTPAAGEAAAPAPAAQGPTQATPAATTPATPTPAAGSSAAPAPAGGTAVAPTAVQADLPPVEPAQIPQERVNPPPSKPLPPGSPVREAVAPDNDLPQDVATVEPAVVEGTGPTSPS